MPRPRSPSAPIGYTFLVETHGLCVMPHFCASRRGATARQSVGPDGRVTTVFTRPTAVAQGASDLEHALFALKHEGTSLEIFAALFATGHRAAWESAIIGRVSARPTGTYGRKLWLIYEYLTRRRLRLADVRRGPVVPLLDPARYVTGPSRRSARHRVDVNLLGDRDFSPVVRREAVAADEQTAALTASCRALLGAGAPGLLHRAASFLYTKETQATFAIENEVPQQDRAARFVALLRRAPALPMLDAPTLAALQRDIVGDTFADDGFRDEQGYVGEAFDLARHRLDFIAPVAADVAALMRGWEATLARLLRANVDALVVAAVLSFRFVYIHPFTDGNGRLHRFVLHYVLSRAGLTPDGFIIPISAVMQHDPWGYGGCLETFSVPLMERVAYEMGEDGRVQVRNETAHMYRYFDATAHVAFLRRCTRIAIADEMRLEIDLLRRVDTARAAVAACVDLPARLMNVFLQVLLRNKERLSRGKRESVFSMLSDGQVAEMERAACAAGLLGPAE